MPRSAAALAGLEVGDIIISVDGQPLASPPDQVVAAFGALVRDKGAGVEVRLGVRRSVVNLRTYVDEEPTGPPQDAAGEAGRALLPDLARLLEEHPDRLVTVRARRAQAEREVRAVLRARASLVAPALPVNASLRPRLEALPLDSGAALAERLIARARVGETPLASTYAALLERLEEDERVDDAYRLRSVRYLHRAPLRLPLATRELALSLRRVFQPPREGGEPGGLLALTDVAREQLDASPAAATSAPPPPAAGSSPEAHGRYALACVELATQRVAAAFAALDPQERAFLAEHLPTLAERFVAHIYLHTDEDAGLRERHTRAVSLLERVDRGAIIDALEALAPLSSPVYLAQLEADLRAAERDGASGGATSSIRGRLLYLSEADGVCIGSSEANEYRRDMRVLIDLGGDDRYHAGELGSGRPDRPAAVLIDLAGDDRYQSTVAFSQGSGLMGVGLLIDASGRDRYTSSKPFAQGSALAGAGLLLDLGGDDVYRGTRYAQGAALLQGVGALVDLSGDDQASAGLYAQGFAGPGSLGVLLARGGDDRYAALGDMPCSYGDPGTYRGMSQGAAVGFRHMASGGVAVLLDEGGSDLYEAGNFSQGGGYYFGWGALVDLGGAPDRLEGSRYSQGFAAHSALGSLWDDGGDDVYRGWVGAQASAAWDLAVTSFRDDGGDDRYEPGPGFSLGASAHNGLALFVDAGGADTYRVAPGRAGPNDYHGGPSVSVFVDAGGGADTYQGGGLADGMLVTHPDAGVLVDLQVPPEDVTDQVVERLFGR